MPLEIPRAVGLPDHVAANVEDVRTAYNEFAGRGRAVADAELDRIDGIGRAVIAQMSADGSLENVTALGTTNPDDRAVAWVALLSRRAGILQAFADAEQMIQMRNIAEEDLRAHLNGQVGFRDPAAGGAQLNAALDEGALRQTIDELVDARMGQARRAEVVSLYRATCDLLRGENPAWEPQGALLFDLSNPSGEPGPREELRRAYMGRLLPTMWTTDGYLGSMYPPPPLPPQLGGARMAAGDFGTGQYDPSIPRDPGYVIGTSPPQPVRLIDRITVIEALGDTVEYMDLTTRTNNAETTAELAALPGSDLATTPRRHVLHDIGHFIRHSNRLGEDAPMASFIYEREGPEMARQQLDVQVLQGDGSAANLPGILAAYNADRVPWGPQTGDVAAEIGEQELAWDISDKKYVNDAAGLSFIDQLYNGMLKVEEDGETRANLLLSSWGLHGAIFTQKTTDGNYYAGSPMTEWMPVLFGVPIVNFKSPAKVDGKIVDGFANYKQNVSVLTSGDDGDCEGMFISSPYVVLRPRMGMRAEATENLVRTGSTGDGHANLVARATTTIWYIRATSYVSRGKAVCKLVIKTQA